MKFRKSSLAAIVGCMVFVGSASAQFPVPLVDNVTITNYCQVKPNGNVHTIIFSTVAPRILKFYFKNVASQDTFVLTDSGLTNHSSFALNPGTYTLKYSDSAGNNPPQVTWPHTIVLRPYTLTPGQGTGCVLNVPVTGVGSKAERVPTTSRPQ